MSDTTKNEQETPGLYAFRYNGQLLIREVYPSIEMPITKFGHGTVRIQYTNNLPNYHVTRAKY